MPLSKNQIRKIFEDIAEKHWMIHSFGYGDTWEMTEVQGDQVKVNYPIKWVVPKEATYPKGGIHHNYDIYVLDLVKKGEGNEMEVESDTFKICSDIVSLLNAQKIYTSFTLDRLSVRVDAVKTEQSQDELTGHRLTLTLVEKFSADYCAVPGTGFGEDDPATSCLPATLTVNGISFTVIPSGDTYALAVKDTDGLSVGEKIGNEWIVPAASGGSGFSLNEYLRLQQIYE